MDQHRRSPLSQATIRYSSECSGGFILNGGLGFPAQLQGLLAPDIGISGNGWSSPFLSMTQRQVNENYPLAVGQVDTIENMHCPLLGHSPNYHPTHTPSNKVSRYQTSAANAPQGPCMTICSLPDDFLGSQTRVEVPDDQFAVQVDYMADKAPRNFIPRFDIDTPQSHEHMPNESQAITNFDWSGYEGSMTETQNPMTSFGAKPLPDDCSCSHFKRTTRGATRLRKISQDTNKASRTHNEGERPLISAPSPPSQLYMRQNRSMRVDEMAMKLYQCSSCCASFAQRQGLTRHSKDKHLPKKRCSFCVKFTWSQGRRYVYQRHLEQEHPGFVSPSVNGPPIARRQGVNLNSQHLLRDSSACRTG